MVGGTPAGVALPMNVEKFSPETFSFLLNRHGPVELPGFIKNIGDGNKETTRASDGSRAKPQELSRGKVLTAPDSDHLQ